jgi:hypothetical protein
MFLNFFKIMDGQNQVLLDSMAKDRQSLLVLEAQDQSFKQAQGDLDKMAAQPLQPNNFFSKDINFVIEIQTLENLSQKYGVTMQLGGVSGTVNSAPKATTASNIALIPYSIVLSGTLQQCVNFIENLENLSFASPVNAISVSAGTQGQINVSLASDFYLLK